MCSFWKDPTLLAILSQPPGTINGVLRVIIQVGQPWAASQQLPASPLQTWVFFVALASCIGRLMSTWPWHSGQQAPR